MSCLLTRQGQLSLKRCEWQFGACSVRAQISGEEPILEEGVSTYHESRFDGTSGFVSKEYLDWKCPRCGWFVGELYSSYGMWHVQGETSYCARCGQKIDWTKPKAEEKTRYEERKAREREEFEKRNKIRLDNMFEGRRRKYGVTPPEV